MILVSEHTVFGATRISNYTKYSPLNLFLFIFLQMSIKFNSQQCFLFVLSFFNKLSTAWKSLQEVSNN